jgi:hypothetical protein
MGEPCDKGPEINQLQKQTDDQGRKLDRVLDNQVSMATDMKAAIDRLSSIIEADIGTRKDVEQLKKDREILYDQSREDVARIDAIMIRNAMCDGAGIFEKFPEMFNWYQANRVKSEQFVKVYAWYNQELGWRRFIPTLMTVLTALLALYVTFSELSHEDEEMDRKQFEAYHSEMYRINPNPKGPGE